MKLKGGKTNALRLLDSKGVNYEVYEYDVKDKLIDGESVSKKLGLPQDSVFKTLVLQGKGNAVYVFLLPVHRELDLKKAANCCGEKKLEMIAVNAMLGLTGYIRGGCSPLGMKKDYPIFIDEHSLAGEKVYISGGKQGLTIGLDPADLLEITQATLVDIVKI